ncbi:helix-turn-helix domain-containing protein [Vibrio parahaemolyticus]|uniref:hypothetical protein n=1 Tax=Vibrio parahaemolyticus TaxID=670 RepID=UPI00226B9197|nr:hypothetical protein [Vibrio parahaemolyticus]MCX8816995.1 helix-turn-helix domain-containing protein [Vibrio parahaemolyticus]
MSAFPFCPAAHNKWSQLAFGANDVELDTRTVLLVICLFADEIGVAKVSDELLAAKTSLPLYEVREHRKALIREGYLWVIDGSNPFFVVYQVTEKGAAV